MKKILLGSAFLCLSTIIYAQKAETAADPHAGHSHAAPVAKLDAGKPAEEALVVSQDIHDFGKIPQGKPVTYIFEVTNKSSQAVKISNVQASCGCTTPEWDRENAIAAGGTTKITVGYNAQAEGPFMKPITITYNEGQTKVINIKGEVWKTPAASAPENSGINEIKN
jgi:hypothetical protein